MIVDRCCNCLKAAPIKAERGTQKFCRSCAFKIFGSVDDRITFEECRNLGERVERAIANLQATQKAFTIMDVYKSADTTSSAVAAAGYREIVAEAAQKSAIEVAERVLAKIEKPYSLQYFSEVSGLSMRTINGLPAHVRERIRGVGKLSKSRNDIQKRIMAALEHMRSPHYTGNYSIKALARLAYVQEETIARRPNVVKQIKTLQSSNDAA